MAQRDHFQRLLRWLDLEAAAEAEQTLASTKRLSGEAAERTGNSLIGLVIRDDRAGLGGRVLVTLGKRDQTKSLPWTRLGVGSPVLLAEEQSKNASGWRGVVAGRSESTIEVALPQWPETDDDRPTFRVDLSSDETARQRQRAALREVQTAKRGRVAALRDVLLGEKAPEFKNSTPLAPQCSSLAPQEEALVSRSETATASDISRSEMSTLGALNDSQRAAIEFALSAEDVAVIHGPPGTGKTTTVVALICEAVRQEKKVLACAPSNLAVDNLLERLLAAGENAVRLGHPARVLPQLRDATLDMRVDAHPDVRTARKLVREARALRAKAAKYTRAKPAPGARSEMRAEASALIADARRMEAQVVDEILRRATVLCATLTSLDDAILGDRRFDLAVIDEACQTTEPACWIPLLRSERVVLAGDHCQLPPTVVSMAAAREGFSVSLMERLVTELGPKVSRQLTMQYRMHEAIMSFSSRQFYGGSLVAAETVRGHLLSDLSGVAANELTASPLLFIDTAGASYDEELEPDGESRRNPEEARLVARQVEQLLSAGLAPRQIAVIAPYSAQVRLLREELDVPGLEIDTVDGFQGREREAVVISLVRSNSTREIGFLADERRMNVALTRARRKLLVIGDSATIGGHEFYARLLSYFEESGAYRTVWEEQID